MRVVVSPLAARFLSLYCSLTLLLSHTASSLSVSPPSATMTDSELLTLDPPPATHTACSSATRSRSAPSSCSMHLSSRPTPMAPRSSTSASAPTALARQASAPLSRPSRRRKGASLLVSLSPRPALVPSVTDPHPFTTAVPTFHSSSPSRRTRRAPSSSPTSSRGMRPLRGTRTCSAVRCSSARAISSVRRGRTARGLSGCAGRRSWREGRPGVVLEAEEGAGVTPRLSLSSLYRAARFQSPSLPHSVCVCLSCLSSVA